MNFQPKCLSKLPGDSVISQQPFCSHYWIGGQAPTGVAESGTDFGDLAEGFVSVTPIQMDMTAHVLIDELKTWNWEV